LLAGSHFGVAPLQGGQPADDPSPPFPASSPSVGSVDPVAHAAATTTTMTTTPKRRPSCMIVRLASPHNHRGAKLRHDAHLISGVRIG
jgi:hypothetical protein